MKIDRMPTVVALSVLSWLIALAGVSNFCYAIIVTSRNLNSVWCAFLVLLGSLAVSGVLRIAGNIAQMVFDLNKFIIHPKKDFVPYLDDIEQCMSDMNQNISEIKAFFEKIANRLDLNKQ